MCKGEFVRIFLSLFRFYIFAIFMFLYFQNRGPHHQQCDRTWEVDVCASTPLVDDAGDKRGGALLVAALARRLTTGRRETSSGVLFFLGIWAERV